MIWFCLLHIVTPGPGAEIYTVGAGGAKGTQDSQEKLYCQVQSVCVCVCVCLCVCVRATVLYPLGGQ